MSIATATAPAKVKESINDEHRNVRQMLIKLNADNGLRDALIVAVTTHGNKNKQIAQDLFSQNPAWSQFSRKDNKQVPYDSSIVTHMRTALSYIDTPPNNPCENGL